MMTHLKKALKRSECVFFYVCYDSPVDPLTPGEDLVNTTAHTIWRITGYHFKEVSYHVTVTTIVCLTQADGNVAKTRDLAGAVNTRCDGTRSMTSLG